jgi:hypothetical protein
MKFEHYWIIYRDDIQIQMDLTQSYPKQQISN